MCQAACYSLTILCVSNNKTKPLQLLCTLCLAVTQLAISFHFVCFLLGDSPASDLYMPTFRNTLSVPSSKAGVK